MTNGAVVLASSELPAYLQSSSGLGNENIKAEHLAVPRLKQMQGISPECDKYHEKYVEGADIGHWLITPSNQNLGEEVYALNVKFTEEFVIWADREAGGGKKGSFSSMMEAETALTNVADKAHCYIEESHDHVLLLIDPVTGEASDQPVLFSMSRSKMRESRNWNTEIMAKPGDRFSSLWKLSSVRVEGKKGTFMKTDVSWVGYAQEAHYEAAKSKYLSMTPNAVSAAA
jgi:hypothetical protein